MIEVSTSTAMAIPFITLILSFAIAWGLVWLINWRNSKKKPYHAVTNVNGVTFIMPMDNWKNMKKGVYGRPNEVLANTVSSCHDKYFEWKQHANEAIEKGETVIDWNMTAVVYFVLGDDEEYYLQVHPIEGNVEDYI